LRQFAERAGGFRIETVPRAGYRLIELSGAKQRRFWRPLVIGAVTVTGVIAGIWLVGGRAAPDPGHLTIELLPFKADASDTLASDVAFAAHDSVLHALSQTRFAVTDSDSSGGAQPSADFLLSADVSSASDGVTATVRMVQAAQHIVVYSHRFSVLRDQASSLPELIGPQVAGSLGWTEPMLRADHRYPSDPKIVADLLQRSDLQQVSWLSGYEHTLRDARAAPDSAVAQIALAYNAGYFLPNFSPEQEPQVVAIGREASARAERLAPDFGDSYIPWCLLHSRALLGQCEERLQMALKRDPNAPWVEHYLADRIKDSGRLVEALDLARHSLAADEFIPEKIALSLRLLEGTGDADSAEQLYRQASRWWPAYTMILWDRLYGLITNGNFTGLERFAGELRAQPKNTMWPGVGDQTLAIVGPVRNNDLTALRKVCIGKPRSFAHDLCMIAFARLGDIDDAMTLAYEAYPPRVGRTAAETERLWLSSPFVTDTDIITGPGSAPLRRDPRYLPLASRLGLLGYWRSGHLPDFCSPPRPELVCKTLQH
jgi:tetratricopeptide (TPR) repeat protein